MPRIEKEWNAKISLIFVNRYQFMQFMLSLLEWDDCGVYRIEEFDQYLQQLNAVFERSAPLWNLSKGQIVLELFNHVEKLL